MVILEYLNRSGPAEWISAIIAVFALVAVGVEYFRQKERDAIEDTQQKRRDQLQLAQAMIEQLSTNEMLLFATTTLDWGDAIILVPGPWREVVKSPCVHWNLADIRDALQPQLSPETRTNPVRLLYRHAFVQLFNHLERMDDLLRSDAISLSNLKPLSELARQLESWDYARGLTLEEKEQLFSKPIKAWYPDNAPKHFIDAVAKAFPAKSQENE
jgi:hypothetical protein